MKVAVLGAGGIGGLVSALLSRGGDRVEVLVGDATASVLRERGVQVSSQLFGDFNAPVDAGSRLSGPVDVCFVAVKATHLEEALDRVPPEWLGRALLVPLLNGIDHLELLRTRYPSQQVVAATIRTESTRVEPGVIVQGTPFAVVELATSAPSTSIELLAARLETVGLEVHLRSDERVMMWDKLGFLAPLALLTTRHQATAGEVRTTHREELRAVIYEVAEVASSDGGRVAAEAILAAMDGVPAHEIVNAA